jgi:hypothetical protein
LYRVKYDEGTVMQAQDAHLELAEDEDDSDEERDSDDVIHIPEDYDSDVTGEWSLHTLHPLNAKEAYFGGGSTVTDMVECEDASRGANGEKRKREDKL